MAEFSTTNQLIHWGNAFNQVSSSDVGFDKSQLSTRKVDRVAMLKTRFVDIISKAQQTLGNNEERGNQVRMRPENADFVENQQKKKRRIESQVTNTKATTITDKTNYQHKKNIIMKRDSAFLAPKKDIINQAIMQHEKKDFEEKQPESQGENKKKFHFGSKENSGIIVQVKATEAIRNKANSKRKRQIEKEREAARYTLENVEASVYINDFYKTYKEFMMLISSKFD